MNAPGEFPDRETAPTQLEALADKIPAVLKGVGTPLKFFGLASILCLPVFSIAATFVRDRLSYDAFIYTLHTYLAVVGMFALISLFSPRSLYHPRELHDMQARDLLPRHNPVLPCAIALIALAMYLTYQALVVYQVSGSNNEKSASTTNAPSATVPPE